MSASVPPPSSETGARVLSVNCGPVRKVAWGGRGRGTRTAIVKTPVLGPVHIGRLGLVGDDQADPAHHGGPDKAVYAFAHEDLQRWAGELGGSLVPGDFGENLTTVGIDPNGALVGERWRVGTALLEICSIRTPCHKFRARIGDLGLPSAGWLKRFVADGRPGPYFRVLEEGSVSAGDPIVVEHRPDHLITVSEMFLIVTAQRERRPELLALDALPESVRAKLVG